MDLSILIPARNELFLKQTIENILEKMRGNTEIIAICDGNWPDPPIDDNPKVTLVYHSESIGQRAATNEAAKMSRAKYIMKCDAHCSFDEGFDVKLMEDAPYDWTIVPRMYNLHAFNWKCNNCGNETYQGPTPTDCQKCNTQATFERVIYWREKRNPTSDHMRFDSDLHFQYWTDFKKRPEAQADLAPTMSLIGACWFMHRERYWELDGMDEEAGSWGQMGTEISAKAWLSGGALMCNKKTWFAHMFRTQGGDFGFPYPNPGIGKARRHSQKMWLGNNWPKQKYPLSWILDRFWPIPGWSDEDREKAISAGLIFNAAKSLTDSANSFTSPLSTPHDDSAIGHRMTPATVGLSAPEHVVSMGNGSDMVGVTAPLIIANEMVKFEGVGDGSNKPHISESVDSESSVLVEKLPISSMVQVTSPVPATGNRVNFDVAKQTGNGISVQNHGSKVTQNTGIVKGLVFYTDNTLDPFILDAVITNLKKYENDYPIVAVSLKPVDFKNNIVLDLKRCHLTMAKQQLAGLQALDTDIAFMVEHDVIYPKCHFEFTPDKDDLFFYNLNWWKVRDSDGQALHFKAKQVSGLCANRNILIEYFSNRVKLIESGEIGGRRHFEPDGARGYRDEAYGKLTDYRTDVWLSKIPYVDIRHGRAVTRNIFDPKGYRGQVTDWTLADEVPFWGKSKGRFKEFINETKSAISNS